MLPLTTRYSINPDHKCNQEKNQMRLNEIILFRKLFMRNITTHTFIIFIQPKTFQTCVENFFCIKKNKEYGN